MIMRETEDDAARLYFEQIKKIPLLSQEEECTLGREVQEGSKSAQNKLVESNLRLVAKIARSYFARDVQLMDLIQEGNLGLIHAVEKFDYRRNVRFASYAAWWIRQYIERFLVNKSRVIRLPHRKEQILRKVQKCHTALTQELQRNPTIEEISKAIRVPRMQIESLMRLCLRKDETEGMEEHEDYTYSPELLFMREFDRETMRKALRHLKERERTVLAYRYALNDAKHWTLKRISDKIGVSPETVRQIEIKAIEKLRKDPYMEAI
jgi:RNA polymerase primary sigma factor